MALKIREDTTLPIHRVPYTKFAGLNKLRRTINACFQKSQLDTSVDILEALGSSFDYDGEDPPTYQGLGQAWIPVTEAKTTAHLTTKRSGNFVQWDNVDPSISAREVEENAEHEKATFELLPPLKICEDIRETIETRLQMRTCSNEFILSLRETLKEMEITLRSLREQVNEVDDLIELAKRHAGMNDGELLATDYEKGEQHQTMAWHYNNTIAMAMQLLKTQEETTQKFAAQNPMWEKAAKRAKILKNKGAKTTSTAAELMAKCEDYQQQVEEIVNTWTMQQTGLQD